MPQEALLKPKQIVAKLITAKDDFSWPIQTSARTVHGKAG